MTATTWPGPLDLVNARRLMREVVTEKGEDFRYAESKGQACFYAPLAELRQMAGLSEKVYTPLQHPGNQPDKSGVREHTGCLIGTILSRWGETRHRTGSATIRVLQLSMPPGSPRLMADDTVTEYLAAAQQVQDAAGTWNEAMRAAEDWLASEGIG